ncbi:MAG: Spy/CpxP family protein refolding chaperone [Polyangiaceae bacterium]
MRKFSLTNALFPFLASVLILPACAGDPPPPAEAPPPPPAPAVTAPAAEPAPTAPVAAAAPAPEAPKPRPAHGHGMLELFSMGLDSLELTAEQKTAIDGIKADMAAHSEAPKVPREKLEADVSDGVAAGKLDHAKTDADIKAMSAAVAATQPAMQDDMNRLYKALNPEQRKKLIETMREKGKEMHGHEGKGPDHADHEHEGHGVEGVLGKLTEDLGLTPEQKDKLRTKISAQMESTHAGMKQKMVPMMKRMDAVGTAFEGDKFDAKKAGVGSDAPDMLKAIASAKVAFVETVISVLTPEQRPKFVAHLQAHAGEME